MRLNGAVMPQQLEGVSSPECYFRGRFSAIVCASTIRKSSNRLNRIPCHHKRVFGSRTKQLHYKQCQQQRLIRILRANKGGAYNNGNNAAKHWKSCSNSNWNINSNTNIRMEPFYRENRSNKKGRYKKKYEWKNETKREIRTKSKDTDIIGNIASMMAILCKFSSAVNEKENNKNYFMRVQQSLMALVHRLGHQCRTTIWGNNRLQRPKSHLSHKHHRLSGQWQNHNYKRTTASSSCGGIYTLPLYPLVAFTLLIVAVALPGSTRCDDGDNFFAVNSFNVIPETTTPDFDYASRGQKKFGDKCENTLECGFPGSICDPKKKSCQCTEDLPVTNHIDKCGKAAAVNESCFFNEQCESKIFQTECRDSRCVCRFEMTPIWSKDGSVECKGRQDKKGPDTYIDPAMIGVLVGMALMFIIICVVLRLFSQARWRENRTIFNTPNPRLMNVSLLRDSKLLHGQDRRGSRMSVRGPSRQPSMVSLRPHSPNPSLGKTGSRTGSHGSNASATSVRSARSNSVAPGHIAVNSQHHERKNSTFHRESNHHEHQHQQPHSHSNQVSHSRALEHAIQEYQQSQNQPNIISNPVAESVTVEIIEH